MGLPAFWVKRGKMVKCLIKMTRKTMFLVNLSVSMKEENIHNKKKDPLPKYIQFISFFLSFFLLGIYYELCWSYIVLKLHYQSYYTSSCRNSRQINDVLHQPTVKNFSRKFNCTICMHTIV